MIPQDAQLSELPDYWQNEIRKLRAENRGLRARLKQAPAECIEFDQLPLHWQKTVVRLRKECARYRTAAKAGAQ